MNDRHLILPLIAYPRQVLGVPPNLAFWAVIALTTLAVLVGLWTGDVLQIEVYLLYLPTHFWLRRAYRADPFVASVWRARVWTRHPWGVGASLRRTQNRVALSAGVSRFS
ncbi:hypothetical protein FHW79_006070 [Azospirillum sp. OGB3]|uniref:hypothetical protein n=1 Tax=Azospirillum sp. OGB3 TaxID=2587012 RepID=UPI001605A5A3|nr:hypothetical protein [Azospirillum sp. OGB3]MBB3268395.1 hypothetical protein [Azospirillum sp. OGB3]